MYVEVSHPCVQHKMALLRNADTGCKKFRELITEITMFVCYEALKNVDLESLTVQTPLAPAQCKKIANELVVVPVLRAGVGMLDGILSLLPTARVGFVGTPCAWRHRDAVAPAAGLIPSTDTVTSSRACRNHGAQSVARGCELRLVLRKRKPRPAFRAAGFGEAGEVVAAGEACRHIEICEVYPKYSTEVVAQQPKDTPAEQPAGE